MIKIVAIFLYTFSLRILVYVTFLIGLMEYTDYHLIFPLFVVMILLPELSFTFVPRFRQWIKAGVEDGDGVLNKADLNALIIHYSTLWCIRLFVIFGLLEAFYGVQVREVYVVGSLLGAFGIETVGFFARKNKVL
jgi:hypothetical protein